MCHTGHECKGLYPDCVRPLCSDGRCGRRTLRDRTRKHRARCIPVLHRIVGAASYGRDGDKLIGSGCGGGLLPRGSHSGQLLPITESAEPGSRRGSRGRSGNDAKWSHTRGTTPRVYFGGSASVAPGRVRLNCRRYVDLTPRQCDG